MIRLLRICLFAVAGLAVGMAAMMLSGRSPMPMMDGVVNELPVALVSRTGMRSSEPVMIGDWPPKLGERYPDLRLNDQDGNEFQLSELAGKLILLELAAVPCKGCQAFAGGKQHGGFAGIRVQPGLDSIHHYADRFAGVKLGKNRDVVLVQLLLYGTGMSSPTSAEVSGWAEHFELDRADNEIVLRSDPTMLNRDVYNLIPGFHLIDRDFVLRSDSSGHHPEQDLYKHLLPMLGTLARQ